MRLMPLASAFLATGGCVSAQIGPTAEEFTALLSSECFTETPHLRAFRCKGFEEEPTEFACRYQRQTAGRSWSNEVAVVAMDGPRWIFIDGGSRCAATAHSS